MICVRSGREDRGSWPLCFYDPTGPESIRTSRDSFRRYGRCAFSKMKRRTAPGLCLCFSSVMLRLSASFVFVTSIVHAYMKTLWDAKDLKNGDFGMDFFRRILCGTINIVCQFGTRI